MQTEQFGGEKERERGRKRERERSTDGRGSRYSGGVEEGNKWKWQLQYTPIENVSLSSLVHPRIFPFLSVHEIQTILPFFPLSLSLFHCIFLSQERERERELCVYLLDFPLSPSIQLSHAAAVSLSSLFIQPTPPSVTVQCGVYSSELELRSYNSLGCAAALCVCVGGVLAAAW